jgi:hypothetical protein
LCRFAPVSTGELVGHPRWMDTVDGKLGKFALGQI